MTTRELLQSIESAKLLDFLADYAKSDSNFDNELRVRFTEPDFERELSKLDSMADSALDNSDEYSYRYREWGYISVDTEQILHEVDIRVEQGHIRLAFAGLDILYRKLLKLYEYQAECELDDECVTIVNRMSDIAATAVDSGDQAYIFERCIALTELQLGRDYGADFDCDLLTIASQFITQENRANFDNALSRFNSGWSGGDFQRLKLNVVRRLDGETAAQAFISSNLQHPAIREIAYTDALSRQDYATAEQLCLTAPDEPSWRGASQWLRKLYAVYEASQDVAKLAQTAEKILLSGNVEFYETLKTHLKRLGTWDGEYSRILQAISSQMSYPDYMKILADESEIDLLMAQLRLHSEKIYEYGKLAAPRFYDEVLELYLTQITAEASRSSDRRAYAAVCAHIVNLRDAGYVDEAAKLIADYKTLFSRVHRRPAFVDELNKIG